MYEFNFGPQGNEVVNHQNNWLYYQKEPFIVISGDLHTSSSKINNVANILKNFIRNYTFKLNDQEFKINMRVIVDTSSNKENEVLINQSFEKFNISASRNFQDAIRAYCSCLIKIQNHKNNYAPHLDIVIVNKTFGDGWGVTYPATIFLQDDKVFDRLVIHEFLHSLGVDYGPEVDGNCSDSNCLMNYGLPSMNICKECLIQIVSNLIVINQEKPGTKFLQQIN